MTLLVSKPNVVAAEELPIAEAVQGGMPRTDAIEQIARERGLPSAMSTAIYAIRNLNLSPPR